MTYKKKGHWRSCPTHGCGRRIYWDHGHKPQELIYKKKLYCCERHRNGAEKVERWRAERKKRHNELLKRKKDGTSHEIDFHARGHYIDKRKRMNISTGLSDYGQKVSFAHRSEKIRRSTSFSPGTAPYVCKRCKKQCWEITTKDLVHGALCVQCYNEVSRDD